LGITKKEEVMRYFVNDFRLMWVGDDGLPDFARPPFAQFSGWVYVAMAEANDFEQVTAVLAARLWEVMGVNPAIKFDKNENVVAVWRGVRLESILDQMLEDDQPALFKLVYDDPAEFGVLQC
jgi:hypothetical protein